MFTYKQPRTLPRRLSTNWAQSMTFPALEISLYQMAFFKVQGPPRIAKPIPMILAIAPKMFSNLQRR